MEAGRMIFLPVITIAGMTASQEGRTALSCLVFALLFTTVISFIISEISSTKPALLHFLFLRKLCACLP